MWLVIGLIVLIVIIIVAIFAYFALEEGPAPLPPAPSPTYATLTPAPAPAPVSAPTPVVTPVVTTSVPVAAPAPSLSPASAPTPSPTITPTPIVTTSTAASGLPSGIKNGDNIRATGRGAIYKVENNKRRHYPNATVYNSWGSPPAKEYPEMVVNSIPLGSPMPQKTTTGTTVPTTTIRYIDKYRAISSADITPGTDQWALYGKTLEDCAKKCATTSGCVGFSRVNNDCWGKTSSVVNSGNATIYFDKSKTASGTRGSATGTTSGTATPSLPTVRPTLYKDTNYGGASWTVPGTGNRTLTGSGIKNEVSSIRVPAGWRLTVYDKDDCTGTSAVYTSDIASLSGTGLNNDIGCVNLAYR